MTSPLFNSTQSDSAQSVPLTPAEILQQYGRFGVHLGLERIERLLADLGNPHHRVPIVHVAGTNGKGSVCAYLSSVLTQAGYRVGRYTSPHLINWNERICLNEQPISTDQLRSHLLRVEAAIDPDQPTPTQFEVLTAAAWLYFAETQVDIAVIEVGLGGRLDATNVCDRPLVSVITSLSREHWQRLGPTLADIAREKAGILKPGRPAVIGPLPDEAKQVVEQRLTELDCPNVWPQPAEEIEPGLLQYAPDQAKPHHISLASRSPVQYSLSLLGEHQRTNSAIAIAALQLLQLQGWQIPTHAIEQGMAQARWPGRLQIAHWRNQPILVDGAHNPAAAQVLGQYVKRDRERHSDPSVTWVVGILDTKDHADMLKEWLQPGDRLYLVPVPDHQSADPACLAELANSICPNLACCQTYANLQFALDAAIEPPDADQYLTVLCGSLYLVGYFFGLSPANSIQ